MSKEGSLSTRRVKWRQSKTKKKKNNDRFLLKNLRANSYFKIILKARRKLVKCNTLFGKSNQAKLTIYEWLSEKTGQNVKNVNGRGSTE